MPARQLQCDACNCRFDLDPFDAGEPRVRCPECGSMVPVRGGGGPPRRRSRQAGSSGTKVVLIVLVIVGLAGLGVCLLCGGLFWWSIRPTDFAEQTEDYAEARKSFKTTLLKSGPSWQEWDPVTPPPGVREVTYNSGDLKLKAWINPPGPGEQARPAVLFLHGGFAFGDEDWVQCKPFRDAGFVTMTPILRGENGQPGNYTFFYDEVDDVIAAAEALAKTPGVDPKRIFVAGHSAGGTLALLAAMTTKQFKACASFSGSPDQVTFVRGNPEMAPCDLSIPRELEMRSPLAFPKSFKCPVRLYWGDQEFAFKFATRKLAEKSTAAGLDVQAIEVPGDHMSSVPGAMQQAITFFQQQK